MNTLIIAEAGSNHNGNFDQALELIDVAGNAGADICKFQVHSADTLLVSNSGNVSGYKDINKIIKQIEMPREWLPDLKKHCDFVGVEFMASVFDEESVRDLVDLDVRRLKVAGFESTDPRFVDMVCSAGLPVIFSAGIGTNDASIQMVINTAERYGISDLTVLHANNAYPTPPQDILLDTITKYIEYEIKVGLSDHTTSIITPALATVLGAQAIEKHFTLNKRLEGPDHSFALEPHQLREMVKYVRYAESTRGIRTHELTSSEQRFSDITRSVVSSRHIEDGELLTKENITTKRPFVEGAVPAQKYFEILGSRIKKGIGKDKHIYEKDIIRWV